MGAELNGSNGYRYERKFLVPRLCWSEVEVRIKRHPALFSEIFPPRAVNNIYLDSVPLRHYFMNVNGVFDRTKVRIRWYGELFGPVCEPVLEFKLKEGLLGKKESFPLEPFLFDASFDIDRLAGFIRDSDLPAPVRRQVQCFEPTLLNRYHRKYFQSADGDYRVTLDSELEFFRLRSRQNSFLHRTADRQHKILELKYGSEHPAGAELVANGFPFRVGKISKYVLGLECLDGC